MLSLVGILGITTFSYAQHNVQHTSQSYLSYGFCERTADCIQGYCENGVCITSPVRKDILTTCEKTADCIEGYCENGVCVLPMREKFSGLLWLKSGCSGLFTCPMNDIFCIIVCNMIWLILIVFSILAGYGAKVYKNKIIPFVYLTLPVIIGIFSVPAAGVVVAFLELISLHYEKIEDAKKIIIDYYYINFLPKVKGKNKSK